MFYNIVYILHWDNSTYVKTLPHIYIACGIVHQCSHTVEATVERTAIRRKSCKLPFHKRSEYTSSSPLRPYLWNTWLKVCPMKKFVSTLGDGLLRITGTRAANDFLFQRISLAILHGCLHFWYDGKKKSRNVVLLS